MEPKLLTVVDICLNNEGPLNLLGEPHRYIGCYPNSNGVFFHRFIRMGDSPDGTVARNLRVASGGQDYQYQVSLDMSAHPCAVCRHLRGDEQLEYHHGAIEMLVGVTGIRVCIDRKACHQRLNSVNKEVIPD